MFKKICIFLTEKVEDNSKLIDKIEHWLIKLTFFCVKRAKKNENTLSNVCYDPL